MNCLSDPVATFDSLLAGPSPLLALAPMQDVTDLPFWRLLARYGGPDVYWTEYSRVHGTSSIERSVVEAIEKNPTGRPAIAQLIGNDPVAMARAARELDRMPIAAVDLNLGCPAPVVEVYCGNRVGSTSCSVRCGRPSRGCASP
jgi:tRNA-dihydrouridine synthase B